MRRGCGGDGDDDEVVRGVEAWWLARGGGGEEMGRWSAVAAGGGKGKTARGREIIINFLTKVCFDVDSIVCTDEDITQQWVSHSLLKKPDSISFEEARLDLFITSFRPVHDSLEKRPPRLSPGIHESVQKLMESGKTVYLVSGGFRQMVNSDSTYTLRICEPIGGTRVKHLEYVLLHDII
ncbi:phosphoserine phosphatase, chloroplastic isoform X2 [Tanacetum coccineum]